MPPRYRVPSKLLVKGAKIEQKEHPWASPRTAKRIAKNHIQNYGPGYYVAEPVTERVIQNVNRKMNVKPIKRKPARRMFNPITDNPFR